MHVHPEQLLQRKAYRARITLIRLSLSCLSCLICAGGMYQHQVFVVGIEERLYRKNYG